MRPWSRLLLSLGIVSLFCGRGSATFTCDGGATALEDTMINDDYCDCDDGSDETLTPACSHKGSNRFACADTGPLEQTVPMSRVWDGVCDCCDGSDEVGERGKWAGLEPTACDRDGCQPLLQTAREDAIKTYERHKAGIKNRAAKEAKGREIMERWKATVAAGEGDEEGRKGERKKVEKLEALLKVYLQDEERLERREREQLAEGNDCDASSASRRKAAKLGPCEDKREERDSAARVRAARLAARSRRDREDEIKRDKADKRKKKNKRGAGGGKRGDSSGSKRKKMGVDGPSNGGSRNSGGGEIGGDSATTETILDLRWPVDATLTSAAADPTVPATPSENGSENDDDVGNGHEETKLEEGTKDEGVEGSGESAGGAMLSLRTYVSRRQAGSAATTGDAAQAEEKKAQELRKTALLGPVLNDGERGVYLGLTILLRMAGLPIASPLRALLAIGGFVKDQVAKRAAAAAIKLGLPLSVRSVLEGYADRGLAGVSPYLDYRRYSTLRAVVLRWDEFLNGSGKFLSVVWDSPVALWEFFLPERDEGHQRPEAAMIREGLALCKASLDEGKHDGAKGRRRREEKEAKRLTGLDLGEGAGFATLTESCLELRAGGYLYSLCPFKEAKQDKHSLGKWKAWGTQQGRDGHRSMLFDGGSRCHNKKLRSAEVIVECDAEDVLVAAQELEIGLYRLTMVTPLACTNESLREVEKRLETLGVTSANKDAEDGFENRDRRHASPEFDRQEL